MKRSIKIILGLALIALTGLWAFKYYNFNASTAIGQKIDELNGVDVYYNGRVNHVSGRNISSDGYNLGLEYQCVEFVKRYYFEHLNHKMPDSYGHAIDFFSRNIKDGGRNDRRNLTQYINPSESKPQNDDLIVYSGTAFNKFGHVAIVSKVGENDIEIIQQNPGPFANSREIYPLTKTGDKWKVNNDRIIGWLRKE